MLTLVDKDGPYQLPTGWEEVSTRQYLDLDRLKVKTAEARASYFAGRPVQTNPLVADSVAFLLKEPATDADTMRYPSELDQECFGQVEAIRQLLSQPLHQCYLQVYGLFVVRARDLRGRATYDAARASHLGWEAADLCILETYPAVLHCLREFKRLETKYAALNEPDHTEAGQRAREAGSERLSVFGHFNVAYHYSQKLGLPMAEIYQLPWAKVAEMLLHDRITAEIQDTLTHLNNPKSK